VAHAYEKYFSRRDMAIQDDSAYFLHRQLLEANQLNDLVEKWQRWNEKLSTTPSKLIIAF